MTQQPRESRAIVEPTISVPPFTSGGMLRGALKAQSLVPGVFVYGAAFGLIADQAGLTLVQALLMSAIVYSGSAQVAAISILAAGPSPVVATAWALIAMILVLNARYLLYSAALRPWMGGTTPFKAYSTLYVLGDGNWLVSMRAYAEGERDAGFIFGSGVSMFIPWLGGTAMGYAASTYAVDPKRLGIDFLMAAFVAAMMAGMTKSRADLGLIAVAAAVSIMIATAGYPGWAPVFAGIAGGALAYWRTREPKDAAPEPPETPA